MNWDALGKLIGWLPGAFIGGVIGGVVGILGFNSLVDRCVIGTYRGPLGPVTTSLACVQTPFGDYYSAPGLAAMTSVVGAALGIVGLEVYRSLTSRGAQPPTTSP